MWSAVVKALLERCRFRPEPDLHAFQYSEYSHSNITEQVLGRDFGELSVIEQFASGVSASFRSHVPTGFGEEQSGSQRGGGLIGVANRAIIAVDEADGGVIGRRSCRRTRNSC